MREAGCARSNETSRYCFAEASAKKDPSDLYYYYLVRPLLLISHCVLESATADAPCRRKARPSPPARPRPATSARKTSSASSRASLSTSLCSQISLLTMTRCARSRYATNSTLAISRTYSSGRSAAALTCGPDFAPALAVQSKVSSASLVGGRASPVLVALALGSVVVVLAVGGS